MHAGQQMVAGRTTNELVEDFALTEEVMTDDLAPDDYMALGDVRGWIMDELEGRNPVAFAAWCETPEMDIETLRALYV